MRGYVWGAVGACVVWAVQEIWDEKTAYTLLAIFAVCALQVQIGGLKDKIEWLEADIRRLKGLD